jgi:hypothetical protein
MTTETITCECGVNFEWTPCDEWEFQFLRPNHCPECETRIEAKREAVVRQRKIDEISRRARESAHHATPAIFCATDTSHQKFNLKGWQKVNGWSPNAEKPWLGLVGETGTCKSRIAYLLAAAEIERMATAMEREPSFQFVAAYEISELVGQLTASSFQTKDEARADLARLRDARLLLIDDLGKGRMTPAVSAEFFALIDHRYCHALPTIWTANSLPDTFAAAMLADMAAPFAGRLNDSSRIILFR